MNRPIRYNELSYVYGKEALLIFHGIPADYEPLGPVVLTASEWLLAKNGRIMEAASSFHSRINEKEFTTEKAKNLIETVLDSAIDDSEFMKNEF